MKRTAHALIALTVLVWHSTAAAQAPGLELRLESDAAATLPGLPVPVRLVAVNSTSRALPLPLLVFIHATNGTEERFIGGAETGWLRKLTEAEEDDPALDARLSIGPRESVTADLSVSPTCSEPSFLLDPFLAQPGEYTLQAIAAPDVNQLDDAVSRGTLAEVLQSVTGAIVSTPWIVEVRVPQSADAEAWAYLTEVSEGKGWLGLFSTPAGHAGYAAELRQRFPDSQYTLCYGASGFTAADAAELAALAARARATTPRPVMLDWMDLQIAAQHGTRCLQKLRGLDDVDEASAECETARALYDQLRTAAENPEVRRRSEEGLRTTMTREDVREFALNIHARESGTFRKVVPVLQCVKESGARLEARFGYENPNPFAVNIVIGGMNFFTPGPPNRGQPYRFLPGVAENVFTVTVDAKKNDPARTIAWTLDTLTVTTAAGSIPRCKGK